MQGKNNDALNALLNQHDTFILHDRHQFRKLIPHMALIQVSVWKRGSGEQTDENLQNSCVPTDTVVMFGI